MIGTRGRRGAVSSSEESTEEDEFDSVSEDDGTVAFGAVGRGTAVLSCSLSLEDESDDDDDELENSARRFRFLVRFLFV